MLTAFTLALGQLGDPKILRVLGRSLLITLVLYAAIGAGAWWGGDWLLSGTALSPDLRGLIVLLVVLIGGWLLWRVLALAVLQFHADEVVRAVEERHYPALAATARSLGWREELRCGLRGGLRAIGFNLVALPVAALLLFTAIGPAIVFWLVNAVLLGRELTELVALRHRAIGASTLRLSTRERFVLGGIVAALLAVPFVNLIAPVLGAAAATHLIHRKGVRPS
jgi:CysZ protein